MAYCQMTNYPYCIAMPKKVDSFALYFAYAHVRSTRQINRREGWKSHVWKARFGSSVLDEEYICGMLKETPLVRGLR